MGMGYSEFLRLVLMLGGILLPGNLLRWIRYKTLGDLLAATANVVLLCAAAWDSWGRDAVASNRVMLPLVVSIGLWVSASILLLLTIIQMQVVAPDYYSRRLEGKDWFDRALFTVGFVWCGAQPQDLDSWEPGRIVDDKIAVRPMRYVLLSFGVAFLCAGLVSTVMIPADSDLERVCVHLYTIGILCTAGGAIDIFIVVQRGKWKVAGDGGPKHCEKCGYDLRGLTEARCPECGRAFPSEWLKGGCPRSPDSGN